MFDLTNLRAAETMPLVIKHPISGIPTEWVWQMAGPGHPQTLAVAERISAKRLAEERLKEQARANGRKWKGDDREPEEVKRENVENLAARVVTFNDAVIDGDTLKFSVQAVVRLLLDPNFGWLFTQVLDFLNEDAAFFSKSA